MNTAETSLLPWLDWAADGEGPMPPATSQIDLAGLWPPSQPLNVAVARLVAAEAARLRWRLPVLGDATPASGDVILLALAASHAFQGELTAWLLQTMAPAHGMAEWVARHALIAPLLSQVPTGTIDTLLAASPLTSIWYHPAAGQNDQTLAHLRRIMDHPQGRLTLQLRLAEPPTDATTWSWRGEVLSRLAADHQDFVLDVYETAMIHFEPHYLHQARQALALLDGSTGDVAATAEEIRMHAAAVLRWWEPLGRFKRDHAERLRERFYLGLAFLDGVACHARARRLLV